MRLGSNERRILSIGLGLPAGLLLLSLLLCGLVLNHLNPLPAGLLLLLNLLLRREDPTPPIFSGFAARETKLHLSYLETALAGNDYIMGSDFSGADVGCGYVANAARQLKLLDDYPLVKAYAKRITERPAFLQAFSKTGG